MGASGWLDIHCHFSLPLSEDEQGEVVKQMHELCFMMPKDWSWSIEDSLAYQETAGVQMQMLSFLPGSIEKLRESNNYASTIVKKYPSRFGLLCALPTEDVQACLEEIQRGESDLHADGYAVHAIRKGVLLSDTRLDPVWERLNKLGAVVFSHPDACDLPKDGRPSPLLEVGFQTCRVVVDMVYRRIFQRYPNIKFVFSHCAGGLGSLAGRLELLGAEDWVPNPSKITAHDIRDQLSRIYVDVAATAATGMRPCVDMVGSAQVIYGADCGVPCSTHRTMEANRLAVLQVEGELGMRLGTVGANGWELFPNAARRVDRNVS